VICRSRLASFRYHDHDFKHSVEVIAETLCEAVVLGIRAMDIPRDKLYLLSIDIKIKSPEVYKSISGAALNAWLAMAGKNPKEQALKIGSATCCAHSRRRNEMAQRPDLVRTKPFTSPQLVELRHRLASLSDSELEIEYKAAHGACKYVGRRIPAKFIQETGAGMEGVGEERLDQRMYRGNGEEPRVMRKRLRSFDDPPIGRTAAD
jgi:hypothetical protein